MKLRILVTGGGTGGHIYPALSLIKKIQTENPAAEFLYVGTQRGLESKIVPKAGIPFKTIQIQGFRRSLSLENLKTLQLFFKSIKVSRQIIREFKPDIVVGTGGYVCGAVVYAAAKEKIPTLIHEQNSVPGITNKFLARYVQKICICFKDAAAYFPASKVVLTGNPRGEELVGTPKSNILEKYHLDPKRQTVVIFGGSQGAQKINEVFLDSLAFFSNQTYQVLYASGERYYQQACEVLAKNPTPLENVRIEPYIEDMTAVLANVQLVVSRAGATTIAELTALGIPAILIPSPYVTNDHQTKNAESLVKVGAARMLKNDTLTAADLCQNITEILGDESLYQRMVIASKKMGYPKATTQMYQEILKMVKK